MPAVHRGIEGGHVSFARELQVERLKPPGGLKQQRGRIAAKTRGEGDVAAHRVTRLLSGVLARAALARWPAVTG
jgi:hypothetical protein